MEKTEGKNANATMDIADVLLSKVMIIPYILLSFSFIVLGFEIFGYLDGVGVISTVIAMNGIVISLLISIYTTFSNLLISIHGTLKEISGGLGGGKNRLNFS